MGQMRNKEARRVGDPKVVRSAGGVRTGCLCQIIYLGKKAKGKNQQTGGAVSAVSAEAQCCETAHGACKNVGHLN